MAVKKCPFCAEEIQEEAIKCKHCMSEIPASVVELPKPLAKPLAEPKKAVEKKSQLTFGEKWQAAWTGQVKVAKTYWKALLAIAAVFTFCGAVSGSVGEGLQSLLGFASFICLLSIWFVPWRYKLIVFSTLIYGCVISVMVQAVQPSSFREEKQRKAEQAEKEDAANQAEDAKKLEKARIEVADQIKKAKEEPAKIDNAAEITDPVYAGDTCQVFQACAAADSIEAWNEAKKAGLAQDTDGLAELVTQGKMGMLSAGTTVKVLDEDKFDIFAGLDLKKVRVLDGELAHAAVWVDRKYLIPLARGPLYRSIKQPSQATD